MIKTATGKEDIVSAIEEIELRGKGYQESIRKMFNVSFDDYKELITSGVIKSSGIDLIPKKP